MIYFLVYFSPTTVTAAAFFDRMPSQ